jgi:1,4-dihydroxy-2-naphthoate octaprenyltransferase
VNNYRDCADDCAVGKRTLAVRCGCRAVRALYLVNGIAAVGLTVGVWRGMPAAARIVPLAYLGLHVALWRALSGHQPPARPHRMRHAGLCGGFRRLCGLGLNKRKHSKIPSICFQE